MAKKQHLEQLIYTARHELSHGMVAYALQCTKLEIRVYKIGQKETTKKIAAVGGAAAVEAEVKCMGYCRASYRRRHHALFVSCGPFASPLYNPSESDFLEFQQLVDHFQRFTGLPAKVFRTLVLEPVKALLECGPMTAIVQRLAQPVAEGGKIKLADYKDLDKFFPKDTNRALLEVMCQQLRDAADELPLKKK